MTNWVRLTGWIGLFAALLVGLGEFCLQYTPNGGVEDVENYLYFNDISAERLSLGHFISVLAAPLYLIGYWHLSKNLEPGGKFLSSAFFCIGAYAFAVGTAWIGQRFFIATTVHEIAAGADLKSQLTLFAGHNEPFVNVLRLAMVLVSLIWIIQISRGRTNYPRWMAIFSPALLLATMFALYFFGTAVGLYVFPVAMNATHFIVFALSLWATRGQAQVSHS